MGLDITAYSHLEHIGLHEFDKEANEGEPGPWCYHEGHVQAYAYETFPRSWRGIPTLSPPAGFPDRFLFGGCFAVTDKTEEFQFAAGSYGGYGAWRTDLANQFNPAPISRDHPLRPSMTEPDPDKPFYELIWFADNEGCIGPEAAADLLADFREQYEHYTVPTDDLGGYYRQKYDAWTRAFELAAAGGLVRFH